MSGHFDLVPIMFFVKNSIYIVLCITTIVCSYTFFSGIRCKNPKKFRVFRWSLVLILALILVEICYDFYTIPDEVIEQMIFQEVYTQHERRQIGSAIFVILCFTCVYYVTWTLEKKYRERRLPMIKLHNFRSFVHLETKVKFIEDCMANLIRLTIVMMCNNFLFFLCYVHIEGLSLKIIKKLY